VAVCLHDFPFSPADKKVKMDGITMETLLFLVSRSQVTHTEGQRGEKDTARRLLLIINKTKKKYEQHAHNKHITFFSLSLSLGAPLAPSISGGGIKFVYEKYFVYLIHAARRFCFFTR